MIYVPHDYQQFSTNFILSHPIAAVLLQMGLGKSVITLTAIRTLLDRGEIHRVLVIAPLRVARDTWPEEIRKWDHLHGLTYSVAVGSEKERIAALQQKVNLQIISASIRRKFITRKVILITRSASAFRLIIIYLQTRRAITM